MFALRSEVDTARGAVPVGHDRGDATYSYDCKRAGDASGAPVK